MADIGGETPQIDMMSILKDPSIAKLYVNGVTVGLSLSDVFMIVNSGPIAAAVIQMSFTTAKTMMQDLSELIAKFEADTGQPLLTMQDIKEKCFKGSV